MLSICWRVLVAPKEIPVHQEYKSLTRAAIAGAIKKNIGISSTKANHMVDAIIEEVAAALERGENVKIAGFGTFLLNDKGPRVGRNPKTGKEAVVGARRVVTFNPSTILRARVAPLLD
jgi:integration host factor subunit alpha